MKDERFNTMKARVVHRDVVTPTLNEITSQHEKLLVAREVGEGDGRLCSHPSP